ncbi:DUF3105 domain-containing protein [Deinococcus aquatilis]|uniref:DUF3105 domain-containing protein n=1 Tax=Deinococcus aquatilis TaxID=519440 RepID=UPI00037A63A1|nr:DUF3105 domain-containing protein [Deinococcus aquatilis]
MNYRSLGLGALLFLSACSSQNIQGVQTFSFAAGDHRPGQLVYAQEPPVGGPHNPSWQNCGVYQAPLYNEYAVHSLEHGAVWITYGSQVAAADVTVLEGLARGRTHVLVSPTAQPSPDIVLSAWGKQLKVDGVQDDRIGAFLKTYEQGPTTPERGAPCTGGSSGTT